MRQPDDVQMSTFPQNGNHSCFCRTSILEDAIFHRMSYCKFLYWFFRSGEDLGSGFCFEESTVAVQRTAPLAQCRSSSKMSCCDLSVPANCGQISLLLQHTRGLLALLWVQHDNHLQQHDCVRWCHHLCLVRSCRRVASSPLVTV